MHRKQACLDKMMVAFHILFKKLNHVFSVYNSDGLGGDGMSGIGAYFLCFHLTTRTDCERMKRIV